MRTVIKTSFKIKILVKIIIILIIIVLAVAAIYFFSKQIKHIDSSMMERKEMDFLVSHQEVLNARIKNDFSNVDPNYQEKITDSLPSVYNILGFVDTMESLSQKYSFRQTLSFSPPAPAPEIAGPIPVMAINFNLIIDEINIESFSAYLQDLENLPYFVSINSINHISLTPNAWQGRASVNISGRLYAKQ
ncbi:MAG: hypothetical protein WCW61_04020 [Patescibacteria group bacterium]